MRDLSAQLTATLQAALRHERTVFLCSFQKEESVILDELVRLAGDGPGPRPALGSVSVVTIDTGVLFPETHDAWKRFEERFGVSIEVEEAYGGWTGPQRCCGDEKVAALERALDGADAWITGLRREQGESRAVTELVEADGRRGIAKYNPLAHWTEKDLWARIAERNLPYHPLHDQGYASIGCACCTVPGHGRDGRWWGTEKTECGLHVA